MSNEIRIAAMEDLAVVEAIVETAYTHYIARIGRRPGPMLDDYAVLISKRLVHLIDSDGEAKGVLVLIPEPDVMLLDNIALLPDAQGLGLGRKMLEFAEQAALDAGYKSIRLYTHQLMTENIELYRRIGYIETHRGEEKGLHRVYMTKLIA